MVYSKGTSFRDMANNDLAFLVKKLNYSPRKSLNYQTPHEVIYAAIHGALAELTFRGSCRIIQIH